MYRISTPVKGFTGRVAGVDIVDGKGTTDNPSAVAYFRRHGYGVEAPRRKAAKPADPPKTDDPPKTADGGTDGEQSSDGEQPGADG